MASLHPLYRPVAAALATLGLLALAPGVWAQSNSSDPSEAPRVDADEGFASPDSSGGFGGSASPFDLIHRAVLSNGTSMEDFNRQQRGHLNTEADNFRSLQQEALRQQPSPEAVETTPQPAAE
jgi:hypothetical protein